jgi:hypothetical protein
MCSDALANHRIVRSGEEATAAVEPAGVSDLFEVGSMYRVQTLLGGTAFIEKQRLRYLPEDRFVLASGLRSYSLPSLARRPSYRCRSLYRMFPTASSTRSLMARSRKGSESGR